VPQGQDPNSEQFIYKLAWFGRLRKYFEKNLVPGAAVIWTGDFNVAPAPIDVLIRKNCWAASAIIPKSIKR
jgi:exodeoxyribonuclease-3